MSYHKATILKSLLKLVSDLCPSGDEEIPTNNSNFYMRFCSDCTCVVHPCSGSGFTAACDCGVPCAAWAIVPRVEGTTCD